MRTNLKMLTILFAGIIAGVFVLNGCKKDSAAAPTSTQGAYKMYLTDAPADYQQVNVDIVGAEANTDGQGWVKLNVTAGVYNLLNYSGGFDTLLATGMMTTGHISQIRLLLGATGNTVMVNNTLYPLQIPNDDDVGLRVDVDCYVDRSAPASITLDFDAGKSIVQTGNNTYKLKPVIRLVTESTQGSIKGDVQPGEGNIAIMALGASDSAYTYTRWDMGVFKIWGLNPGVYTLMILPRPPYAIKTVTGVSVTANQVTDVGTIKL